MGKLHFYIIKYLTKQCDKSQHNKEEENFVELGKLHFYIIKYLIKQCDKSQHN